MKKIFYVFGLIITGLLSNLSNAKAQWTSYTGMPIAYWDFELNSARTTVGETTPDVAVNSGCIFDGKFGISTATTRVTGANATAVYAGTGSTAGSALQATGWQITAANPGNAATSYFQFSVNTSGLSNIIMGFDFQAITATIGVNYSIDGGTTWTNLGITSSAGTSGFTFGNLYTLPTTANNNPNLKIRIYGWNTASSAGTISIDNLQFLAGSTVAGGGTLNAVDMIAIGQGHTSGAGTIYASSGTFTINSGTEWVVNNNTINSGPIIAAAGAFVVNGGGQVTFGSNGTFWNNTGTFTLNSGATLKTANVNGITAAATASGSVQTATRNFSTGANYVFNGTGPQLTNTGTPTAFVSPGSLTVNNSAGVSLSFGTSFATGATLNLTNGTLGGSVVTMNTGSAIVRDNGTLGIAPTFGGAIDVTYANLGNNAAAVTTGNELPSTATNLNNFTVNKTGATITLNNAITVNGNATITAGVLDASASNFNITDKGNWTNNSGTGGFVPRASTTTMNGAAAQSIGGSFATTFNNLTVNNTSTAVVLGVDGTALNGALLLTAGGLDVSASNYSMSVKGNFTNNVSTSGFNARAATVTFNGSSAQTIGGSFANTFNNFTLNNVNGAVLNIDETINGTLALTNGTLNIGATTLTLGLSSPAIAGTFSSANMIIANGGGQVKKMYNALGAYLFPIGDNSGNYSPLTLNFTSGSFGGGAYVTANVTKLKHPNNTNTTNYINRYWTIATNAISSPVYDATATYVPGDVVGVEANMEMASYFSALPWLAHGLANTATHSFTATGLTTAGRAFSGLSSILPTVTSSPNVSICTGGTTTLSVTATTGDPAFTYSWSPSATLSASTGSSVTANPTSTTTYTVTVTDGNGFTNTSTTTVTVNALPTVASITPSSTSICIGTPVTFTAGTASASGSGSGTITSYNWSGPNSYSSTTAGASQVFIPASTAASGVYSLTVTYSDAGCTSSPAVVSSSVTVNPPPPAITGNANVCVGATTTLADLSSGGAWTSGNTSIATVGAGSGVVTGVAIGNANITYTVGGCIVTQTVTVNPIPFGITGTLSACIGQTTTLSNALTGGTWLSGNTTAASIGVSSGVVTGNAAGNSTITYTSTAGCQVTAVVTVNATPPNIGGPSTVCTGATINLTNTSGGGTWLSSNTAVATISASGVVFGVTAGTADITYTLATGCMTMTNITVNQTPAAIGGATEVCVGLTTTLTDADAGGIWASSIPGRANINFSTGIVTGVATGTVTISYTLTSGCRVTQLFTVNPTPSAIGGTAAICNGGITTLTNATTGGTWFSNTPSVATIGVGTGVVTSVTPGTTTITYTLPAGCTAIKVVTINAIPSAIGGATTVCVGSTATLTDADAGGTWTSSSTGVATIAAATGVATGASAGTTTITYKLPTTCQITSVLSVNPVSSPITGTVSVCIGSNTTLADVTTGGTWVSSNTANATVGSLDGIVAGVAAGTSTISYVLPTGCVRTTTVSVNALPTAITGVMSFCTGTNTTLSNATTGGTWTSSTGSVATAGLTTGVVMGISAGNSTITYKLSATGCTTTAIVTVNPLPAAITGTNTVCIGLTTTLDNAVTGGTWSSTNTLVATIGAANGVVSGAAAGTTTISYILSTGCYKTLIVTVNPLPTPIYGTPITCEGSTTTLFDATAGGTWSSSAVGVATVVATTGIVRGITAGNADITYRLPTGCIDIVTLTVDPLPAAITGTGLICIGATTTLGDVTTGGTWSSTNTGVATVGASTGIVTGAAAGGTNISYTLPSGCKVGTVVTVQSVPANITGANNLCTGTTTTLSNSTAGGTWSSNNLGVATVAAGGVVTGVATGVATISYILPTGCYKTMTITVNQSPAPITGTFTVCTGGTTTLSTTSTGGFWSTSAGAIASVVYSSGVVTGVTAGVAPITFTLPPGCRTVSYVTVNVTPANITGPGTVCVGSITTLTESTGGGTWASDNTGVATVGIGIGVVTGISAGTANISYVMPSGCQNTTIVTVNSLPAPITGTTDVCIGATTVLSNATIGGTWISSVPSIASIGSTTGIVSGLAAGSSIVTYKLNTGCMDTTVVTVQGIPSTIGGVAKVCEGGITTLTDVTPGGVWSSVSPAIADIDAMGIVTGYTAGTATISYTMGTGCARTIVVTVNPLPTTIAGTTNVCLGLTTTLSSTPTGGTWASSNASIAGVALTTGVVIGNNTGNAVITYKLATGCQTTTPFTVNPLPAAITGGTAVCFGSTTTLNSASTGGTWASTNAAVATIDPVLGAVTTVSVGTSTITYTLPTGCIKTAVLTVNPLPSAIGGVLEACVGNTTTLSNSAPGGTWSSGYLTVATIGMTNGIVTGIAGGTAVITYKLTTGCIATAVMTVDPLPAGITGTASVCLGLTTTLSNASVGGTWFSSNNVVATIDAGGVVAANAVGTSRITYTLPTGCYITRIVTVNALPAAIAGVTTVCEGNTTTLTDATAGGTWTSSNSSTASVLLTNGFVTGVSAGVATITYTLGSTGCINTTSVLVNQTPTSITGTLNACVGSTSALDNAVTGGIWSSGNITIATIGSIDGVVSALNAGTATITYVLSTGCRTSSVFTVYSLPAAIGGLGFVCTGSSINLSDGSAGGAWTSSNNAVATVTAIGTVFGVTAGVVDITYTMPSGCLTTKTITVNQTPPAITGAFGVCVGTTTTLDNATLGGVWSSNNTTVATVGLTDGIVNGMAQGNVNITYTVPSGCKSVAPVTVNPLPGTISGANTLCIGLSTLLTDPSAGGSWLSTNTSVATVGSGTGLVIGVSSGTSDIIYTLPTGCSREITMTVVPPPSAIAGPSAVCIGQNIILTNSVPGGSWTTSTPTVATVNSGTGLVSGMTAGTTTITYTLATGCRTTTVVTVEPLPSIILGTTSVCAGSTTTLSNGTFGGTWSSYNPAVATVNSSTGIVTGVTAGTTIISYIMATGCYKTIVVSVNPLPSAIMGATSICRGSSTTLSNVSAGGVWSSSNTLVATIGASNGGVFGVSAGTTTITYTLAGTCSITTVVTVNDLPTPISGTTTFCVGGTTTLLNGVTGGTWSSGNVTIATIDPATGIASGLSAGIATITYSLGTGCRVTTSISVNPQPAAISGSSNVCEGSTIVLHDVTASGTWSSNNTAIATVTPGPGNVTGIAAGFTTISYTLTTGCYQTYNITVNPVPSPIAGVPSACVGATTTLSNALTGGVWTSTNTTVATVGLGTGIVTGISPGSSSVTYTMGTGCITAVNVVINANPSNIGGITSVCTGSIVTLTNVVSGGTWSSSNDLVATAGIANGIIQGVSVGTTIITYTLSGNCYKTTVVTVNPAPPAIVGDSFLCVGLTSTLTEASPGGTWSSSSPSVASVGLTSGIVSGLSGGTAYITYSLTAGCRTSKQVTINPAPTAIYGTASVCIGRTTTLNNTVPGGTWSSSNILVAVIDIFTGEVTGLSAGTSTITYSLGAGCTISRVVTVNPTPPAIVGTTTFCAGATTTLTDAMSGGIWSSSNSAVAPVSTSTGVVTSISAGSATITYFILGTGCSVTTDILINPVPAPIAGITQICEGGTSTLTDTTPFGTWSTSNSTVATIGDGTGVLTGLTSGLDTVYYTLSTGCNTSVLVGVNPPPAAITGTFVLCQGSNATISDATPFGTWSSSDPTVALVSVSVGLVTGVSAGNAYITYKLGTGCLSTVQVTVNARPAEIEGDSTVCEGANIFLANAAAGGTWSSSNTAIGSIDPSGNLSGIAAGTATITYTIASGCYTIRQITVNPTPGAITGATSVCQNFTTTLFDALPGGSWSSSSPAIASIDTNGVVTGVTAGLVLITYTSAGGCLVTSLFTVNGSPAAITGTPRVCEGNTDTLHDATPGGVWSSTNTTLATIDAGGVVTGIFAGVDTIAYTLGTGCKAYLSFTVDPVTVAGVISGGTQVCLNASITLTNTISGGVWSSADSDIVKINATTGVATGTGVGTTTITYTVTTICGTATATANILVNPLPDAGTITGSHFVCVDYTTTLADTAIGGTWASSNTAKATVSATGVVSGISSGTATIYYIVSSICGFDTANFALTINTSAPLRRIAIHADSNMCANTMYQNFGADTAQPSGLIYTWTAVNAEIYQVSANRQNALVSFPNSGVSVVKLSTSIVSSGCTVTDSFVANIGSTVSETPEVKYYASELICTDNTADSYQWGYDDMITLDSTIIRGQTHQDYYLPVPDFGNKYYWCISSHGDCKQKTYYNVPTGVACCLTTGVEIRLFPNPADSRVNIEVTGIDNGLPIEVKVTDMLGKDVQTAVLNNGKGSVSVSELPSAVYSVSLIQNGNKIGARIFVKN